MPPDTTHGPEESISLAELDSKFAEIKENPADLARIQLHEKMHELYVQLNVLIEQQRPRFKKLEDELSRSLTAQLEEMNNSRRRVQTTRTDLAQDVILKRITDNFNSFRDRFIEVRGKWLALQSQADHASPEPTHPAPPSALNYKPRPVHGHGHDAHGANTPPEFGNHKWTEREEDEKKPIIDIPVQDLEKLLDNSIILDIYTNLAQGNEQGAMEMVKELFDSVNDTFLKNLLEEYNYSVFEFKELWTEKLWEKIFDIIKQVAEEDIKDAIESRISSTEKMKISSPRKGIQTAVSTAVIGTAAGVTFALAGTLGAPALVAGAVAGLSGVAGRRAITGWWDWATEAYKNIGKEAEAQKKEKNQQFKKEEILTEVLVSNSDKKKQKVREMASWISQALRDATAEQAVAKEKKAAPEEKTGLRTGDDANLYVVRMNAAQHLREELFEDDADIAGKKIASLDTLLNGINIARHSSGETHETVQKDYQKKADRKSAKYVHALGEFGADAEKVGKGADDEKKTIGNLKFMVAGASIGAGLAGLAAGSWIPAGIAAAGAGYVAYERARRGDLPHIDEKFEKNLEETAQQARDLIADIQKLVGDDFNTNKKEIMEKVKKLEGILASGAFAKNKPMELLARNAIHDAMRGHGLEFLDIELRYANGEAQRITEKETKRLTKKKFNWDKITHTIVVPLVILGVKFLISSSFSRNNDVHPDSADSPKPTPGLVVAEADKKPAAEDGGSSLVVTTDESGEVSGTRSDLEPKLKGEVIAQLKKFRQLTINLHDPIPEDCQKIIQEINETIKQLDENNYDFEDANAIVKLDGSFDSSFVSNLERLAK